MSNLPLYNFSPSSTTCIYTTKPAIMNTIRNEFPYQDWWVGNPLSEHNYIDAHSAGFRPIIRTPYQVTYEKMDDPLDKVVPSACIGNLFGRI